VRIPLSFASFARAFLSILAVVSAVGYFVFVRFPKPTQPALTGTLVRDSLHVGDRDRTFAYYAPSPLPPHPALVIAFHGSGETGEELRWHSGYGFDRVADAHGFVVVYPDGYEHHWDDCRAMASYAARTLHVDDLGFTRALIGYFQSKLGADKTRVFAAGHSNGGHMVYRLALEMPGEIRAVAAISASLPTPENADCEATGKPTPVLIMNGTEDGLNPYGGGQSHVIGFGSSGDVLSSIETAQYFAGLEGASMTPVVERVPGGDASLWVERSTWGAPTARVVLDTVHGGGHVVPQSLSRYPRILGRTDQDFDGPAEIWRFFEEQDAAPGPAPASAAEPASASAPGPAPASASASASASAQILEDARAPAGRRDDASGGGRAGTPCVAGSCSAGLACCETGFRGDCGGAYLPEKPRAPCVVTRTCEPGPCRPMTFPP
jgi:polyhydroxybutyrate depolymerase